MFAAVECFECSGIRLGRTDLAVRATGRSRLHDVSSVMNEPPRHVTTDAKSVVRTRRKSSNLGREPDPHPR